MSTRHYLAIYLTIIAISLSLTQIQSKAIVDLGAPYLINGSEILLNITESKVSQKERAQYFQWVGLRDSFYYSGRTDLLIQLINYFTPEAEDYFSSLFIFGIIFFILAGILSVALILYLILRFGFKMFTGPKKYERSFGIFTWIIILIGASISFIALSIAIYNSNKFDLRVQDVLLYEDAQITQMQTVYDNMTYNQGNLTNSPYTQIPIQTLISNIDQITDNHYLQKEKLSNFTSQIRDIQNHKFNYEISYMFFVYILGIMGIGSYFLRKIMVTWAIFFSLIVLSIPATIILGLNCTYVILSTDFCQNIGKAIIHHRAPIDSAALGVYISCPSIETMKYLRISMYEFSISFNNIYNDVNAQLKLKGDSLPEQKRDNRAFEVLMEKYKSDNVISTGINSLILTNNILASILSQISCQTAYSSINYIEEHFCNGAIDYLFSATMIQIASIVGAVILAIGINKLIVVIDYKNSISLRGNKKYNDALYEENPEESENDISFNKR